ncbi:MAG: hypothetical protein QOD38_434 [Acidimicrobiaceae bacterium]
MRKNFKVAAALVIAGVMAFTVYGGGPASGAGAVKFGPWGKGAPKSTADARANQPDGGEPTTADATATMNLLAHSTGDFFVDEAPTGQFTPGDRDIFTEDLRNADNNNPVGFDHVTCTKQIGNFMECAGTAKITGRGKIEFGGTTSGNSQFIYLPITGGSGEFATIGGQVIVDIYSGPDTAITVYIVDMS